MTSAKAQAAADARAQTRSDLRAIREALAVAPTTGDMPDYPEGSVTVTISHTLSRQWCDTIDAAARLI